jgi:hypothetical protein
MARVQRAGATASVGLTAGTRLRIFSCSHAYGTARTQRHR